MRGGVVGVDAATGATRWSATVDGSPHGQLVTDDRDRARRARRMDHGGRVELHVLDGATGAERWSTSLGVMTGLPARRRAAPGARHRRRRHARHRDRVRPRHRRPASGPRAVAGSSEAGRGRRSSTATGSWWSTVSARSPRSTARPGRRMLGDRPADAGLPRSPDRDRATRSCCATSPGRSRSSTAAPGGTGRRSGPRASGSDSAAGRPGWCSPGGHVVHHQVVGLPPAMLTMRTPDRTPPVPVGRRRTVRRTGPAG